jgi:hypothetical protein
MEQVKEAHFLIGPHGPYYSPKLSPVAILFDKHQIPYSIKDGCVYLSENIIIHPRLDETTLLTEALDYIQNTSNHSEFFSPRFSLNQPPSKENQIYKDQCLINFSQVDVTDYDPEEMKFHSEPFLVDCLRKGDYYWILDDIGMCDVLCYSDLIVTESYVKEWNNVKYNEWIARGRGGPLF